ncbi:MAG: rhodanese-like domain-containing protein [Gammaproteobacteria bacterium]|nr:rhodanese-like domain-containing protein [Gammaproteobacteria bacterium]MDH5728118.1 rhodanese-like domain-containing protein [Gammaproteobacteria bacterium]
MNKTISVNDLKILMESQTTFTLIEALPKSYYDAEHLPNAINIPNEAIIKSAQDQLPDKQATIVVYCASSECKNSQLAADDLRSLGYTNVHEFTEGKQAWKDAGLPLQPQENAK